MHPQPDDADVALDGDDLEVVVGGLGLGYTAATVLDDARVGSLLVVDALAELIGWHRGGLVPVAATLTADDRCRLIHGDFFALTAGEVRSTESAAVTPVPVPARRAGRSWPRRS